MTQQPVLITDTHLPSLETQAHWLTLLSHIPVLLQKLQQHGLQKPERWAETLQIILPHRNLAMLYPQHIALWAYAPSPTYQTLPYSSHPERFFPSLQNLQHRQLPTDLQNVLATAHTSFPTEVLCVPLHLAQQHIGTLLWWFSTAPQPPEVHTASLLSEQMASHLALAPLLSSHTQEPPLQTFLRSESLRETTPSIRHFSASSASLPPKEEQRSHPTTASPPSASPLPSPSEEDAFFPDEGDSPFSSEIEPTLPAARPASLAPPPMGSLLSAENQDQQRALDDAQQSLFEAREALHKATQLGESQRQKLIEFAHLSLTMHEQLRELQTQRRLQTPEPFTQLNQAITQLLPKLQRSLVQLEEHYQHLAETHPQESQATYHLTSTSRSLLNYLAQWSDYNRCLLGQIQPKISSFSLTTLLEQRKRSFRPQLEHKAITWRWELHDLPLVDLEGDEDIVSSLLSLIVGYAIDQCPSQGHIQLVLQSDPTSPPSIQMRFEHPHPPLENTELQRLLEPFEEGANAVFIPRLSLALAKQLSRIHQGHLALQYKDKHLIVLLRLPLQLPKRTQHDARPALDVTRELPLLPSFPKQWRLPFAEQIQHPATPSIESLASSEEMQRLYPNTSIRSPYPNAPSAEMQPVGRKASTSLQTLQAPRTERFPHSPSFDRLHPPPSSTARATTPLRSPYTSNAKSQSSAVSAAEPPDPEIEFIELTPTQAPQDLAVPPVRTALVGGGQSSTFGQLDTLAKQFPLYPMQSPSQTSSEDKHASRTLPLPPKLSTLPLVYSTASGAGEEPQLLDGLQFLQFENHLFPTLEELAHQAQHRPPRLILFGPDDQQAPQIKELRTRIEDQVRVHVPMLEKQGSIDFYRFHWSHYRSLPFSATHLLQWLQAIRISRPRQEKQLLVTGPSTLWGDTGPLLQFLCGPRYHVHLEANPQTCAKVLHRNPPDLLLAQIDQNDPAWEEFFQELHQTIHLPIPPLLIFALTQLSQELNLLLQPFQQILFLPA